MEDERVERNHRAKRGFSQSDGAGDGMHVRDWKTGGVRFSARGAKVVFGCRNVEKGDEGEDGEMMEKFPHLDLVVMEDVALDVSSGRIDCEVCRTFQRDDWRVGRVGEQCRSGGGRKDTREKLV